MICGFSVECKSIQLDHSLQLKRDGFKVMLHNVCSKSLLRVAF